MQYKNNSNFFLKRLTKSSVMKEDKAFLIAGSAASSQKHRFTWKKVKGM